MENPLAEARLSGSSIALLRVFTCSSFRLTSENFKSPEAHQIGPFAQWGEALLTYQARAIAMLTTAAPMP